MYPPFLAALFLLASWILLPVGLILLETFQQGRGEWRLRRIQFRLKTVFLAISLLCLLLALARVVTFPKAALLVMITAALGCMIWLVLSDLIGKRNTAVNQFRKEAHWLKDSDETAQFEEQLAASQTSVDTSTADAQHKPKSDMQSKWWLKRAPRIRRFGLWK